MAFDSELVFTSLNSMVVDPVFNAVDTVLGNMSSNLAGPVKIMAIIAIAFYGYKLMLGQFSATEFIKIICRIAVITLLVTKASAFNYYVKDLMLHQLPDEISSWLVSNNPVDANTFDTIMRKTIAKTKEIGLGLGWGDIGNYIILALINILVGIFCSIGFSVQLIAKVGLALVIALGPLFIGLYMWDSTRRFTEAWIGQVANFIILQILVTALASILTKIYTNLADQHFSDVRIHRS